MEFHTRVNRTVRKILTFIIMHLTNEIRIKCLLRSMLKCMISLNIWSTFIHSRHSFYIWYWDLWDETLKSYIQQTVHVHVCTITGLDTVSEDCGMLHGSIFKNCFGSHCLCWRLGENLTLLSQTDYYMTLDKFDVDASQVVSQSLKGTKGPILQFWCICKFFVR